ncbi:hypothetical protein A2999_00475 [Candidatus Wolfebacteria bacterium RIFCSPLOWO2_01_FULL_38_11]|uniref:3D domain-containing protein n=2 Tax=Candidatus Wolfeibacteriota TaxID=1752735 RepID=A0A0G0GAQ7_9BACT|nr:MAG: hypothetical protein US36_C0004G0026 [Candidatus Wolfebacteria bacterium GW2011_GWC1_37_10]OGM91770.1 MAG: hypothetical protein A2999_00475 [Candidatus Wolfebacteria bacterium RIFCSPLOWO2_01_FULL_38_11]
MKKYNKYAAGLLIIMGANLFQPNLFPIKSSFIKADSNFNDALVAQNRPLIANSSKTSQKSNLKVWVTAYSSTERQTDDTPFITASGNHVRNGIAAANFLPFGTKFRIPELFGSQIFTVEDRMHSRFKNYIDIWFEEEIDAKRFGKQFAKVEIL